MLQEIDKDVWVAEQPMRYMGLSIGTRMTVIRLVDQSLSVISPIQIDDETATKINQLGKVEHIIAPNLYHYFFAESCKTLYPKATFWATPGLKEKQPELSIDRTIERSEKPLWEGLDFQSFDGFRTLGFSGFDSLNECVFFHAASRTLILTDTAFHFDENYSWLTQLVFKVGGTYKQLSPSRLEKIAITEQAKVRQSVEQILRWDFERVVMAHGTIIEKDGKAKLKQGYEQFLS